MTKAHTTWIAALVLAASCLAAAEQPVWYPAQQAPQSSSSQTTGQAPQSPAQGAQQPAEQPAAAPSEVNDPRVDQPMQPVNPPAAATAGSSEPAPAAALAPDTTPLNSTRDLTLGTPGGSSGRSFLTPSLRMSTSVMMTRGIPGVGTESISDMSGTINAVHSWAHAALNLDFTQGGNVYSEQSNLNASFEQYGLGLRFNQARWSFSLTDSGSYLPSSAFGFYGTQFLGGGGGGLGAGYVPNQSIYTENAGRISNAVVGETIFELGPKSSLHFSGSWGILRFQSGGMLNSDNLGFGAGFDRKIGGAGTLGVSYSASLYSYGGSDRTNTSHTISLAYGRRITGKVALQVSGGPEIRTVDDPLLGSESEVSFYLRTGLTFQVGKVQWSSSFTHYASGGSGVFAGADTYQWNLTASRRLGRQMQGGVNVGIARNASLFAGGLAQNVFNYQFAGFQLSRVFSREWSVFLNYNLQHQTSGLPVCVGCGNSYTRHIVGVGFEWHGRPMTGWF